MRKALYILPILILLALACIHAAQQPRSYIAVTKATIYSLQIALTCYHQDVGYYPPGDAEKDEGNINMVLALFDKRPEEGGKGGPMSPYYEFRDSQLKPSKYAPSRKVLIDPWDIPYRYVCATDDKGNVKPGMLDRTPFAIWSCGPNMRDENGLRDDINSWSPLPYSSESRSWGLQPDTIIGIVFAVLGLVAGLGLLFVRTDESSVETASKISPIARLYRYGVFRYFIAVICFILALYGICLVLR